MKFRLVCVYHPLPDVTSFTTARRGRLRIAAAEVDALGSRRRDGSWLVLGQLLGWQHQQHELMWTTHKVPIRDSDNWQVSKIKKQGLFDMLGCHHHRFCFHRLNGFPECHSSAYRETSEVGSVVTIFTTPVTYTRQTDKTKMSERTIHCLFFRLSMFTSILAVQFKIKHSK